MIKRSEAINCVNVEPKTNVSIIFSVSIIRVGVVNHHVSLIFIPVCEIDASSYWKPNITLLRHSSTHTSRKSQEDTEKSMQRRKKLFDNRDIRLSNTVHG
jgi:hypothetical protein